jgi:DNA repair exonuclease SbcCD ATPase subunit
VIEAGYGLKDEITRLRADISSKRAVYDAAKAKVENVRKQLKDANDDLTAVNFNNALLKRVRAARPVIANKLWSKVLAAVSRYFSQMRGEESVVTKDGDGFKVNGKLIENLSGSALDLLGLAIRLALVRTFLPHAPFLILDEPAAACNDERTESMMGFLVACGFNQMLIVTHEDLSEKVASSLIEI